MNLFMIMSLLASTVVNYSSKNLNALEVQRGGNDFGPR